MANSLDSLDVWQLANQLRTRAYLVADREVVRRDHRFSNQLRDCASSVTRNIAEGFGHVRPKEFARFVFIARGSLFELRDHLSDGVLRGYWSECELAELRSYSRRTTGALNGLIRYLRSEKAAQAAARWEQTPRQGNDGPKRSSS